MAGTHRRVAILALACLLGLVLARPAWAHKPSDSYLRITGGAKHLTAQWDIALKDLQFLIGLDANHDSKITWGEVKAKRQAITARALSRLSLSADGRPCDLRVTDLLINEHSDGAYATLVIKTNCPGDAQVLHIRYHLLFTADPTHHGLVLYRNGDLASTHVLSPDKPTLELHTGEVGLWQSLLEYVKTGIWHIWLGFDHILFLLTLLLPAVLIRRDNHWQAVDTFGPACKAVVKMVTMFTLAHSITLWLSASGYVSVPGRLAESVVALSILFTAVSDLIPKYHLPGWIIAFTFGLAHGFAFASVLTDLGLTSGWALGVALLGFNSGVELGQLAIVLAFFPIAYLLRRTWFYQWVVLRAGCVLIALVAGLWLVERAFNMRLIPF